MYLIVLRFSGWLSLKMDSKIYVTQSSAPMRQSLSKFKLIGTHGFQIPLVCPKGVGWGNVGVFDSRGRPW